MNTSQKILSGVALASALFLSPLTVTATTLVDWTFDAYTAGQTINSVTDSVTLNGNATTGANPTAVANTPNSDTTVSASFSGNNYLSTSSVVSSLNFATNQAFTIEGWFNLNNITSAQDIISDRTTTNIMNSGWFAVETAASGAGLTFSIKPDTTTSSVFSVTATQTLSTGTWYYFAATRDSSGLLSVSLYSTTALLATSPTATARPQSLTSTSGTFLGARASDLSTRLSSGSLIDEIRISDTNLSGAQLLWTSAIPEPSTTAGLVGLCALICASVITRRRKN